jgi:hypothetical protein
MSKDIAEVVSDLSPERARSTILNNRRPVIRKKAESERPGLPPIKKASALVAERMSLPPELVEGLLHRGSTMVYGGGSKTNKTFAMMDLAVSVASGSSWWGLKTSQGRVLYMEFELQQAFFRERLDKIANAKGIPMGALDEIDVWNLRGHATDLSSITEEIIMRIKDTPYSLIVIDPIYKVLGERDENSAGDINSLMNELDKIAVASNAAIVVGHHFSKGNQAGKESMDRISGSGVFGRSPDAIVIITKHEQQDVYTVETTLRNHKSLEPFCVEWTHPLMVRNTSLDPKKLKKPGAFAQQFTTGQLLMALGNDEMTTSEWMKQTCDHFKMSESSFNAKKRILVNEEKTVVKGDNDKWKATTPLGIADTKTRALLKETQLQTATTAIAPIAA